MKAGGDGLPFFDFFGDNRSRNGRNNVRIAQVALGFFDLGKRAVIRRLRRYNVQLRLFPFGFGDIVFFKQFFETLCVQLFLRQLGLRIGQSRLGFLEVFLQRKSFQLSDKVAFVDFGVIVDEHFFDDARNLRADADNVDGLNRAGSRHFDLDVAARNGRVIVYNQILAAFGFVQEKSGDSQNGGGQNNDSFLHRLKSFFGFKGRYQPRFADNLGFGG